MTPEEYRAALDELSTDTEMGALAVWAALRDGETDQDAAVLALAGLLNRADARAVTLADIYVSSTLELEAGEPVPAVGLVPEDHSTRLTEAAQTVLQGPAPETPESSPGTDTPADLPDPPETIPDTGTKARVSRLARSEPVQQAARAAGDAITRQPLATGWVRDLNPGACALCQWRARGGRVWPASHPMWTHPNCGCVQRVVTVPAGTIKPVPKRRKTNAR